MRDYVTYPKFTTKPHLPDIFVKLSLPSSCFHVGILFTFAALGISSWSNLKFAFSNRGLVLILASLMSSRIRAILSVFSVPLATIGHFRVHLCLCFKTRSSAKPFIWKWFCMQFHFHANQSHFHKNGFALRLVLKQRHKGTRKWPMQLRLLTVCTCILHWHTDRHLKDFFVLTYFWEVLKNNHEIFMSTS